MAAERITQNPHLEIILNFAGPHYEPIQALLVNNGQTEEEAVQFLTTPWMNGHQERMQAWDQQVINNARDQEEQRQLAQEQEDQVNTQRELEAENERQEAEKKRPKMNGFDKDTMVNDFFTPCPSPYTLCCLEDFDYVELWYFTQDGCADATQNKCTQNEDTFGLTRSNDMVALRPVSTLKASKNVILDIDLTWRQMGIAKSTLIQHMTKSH